MESRGLLIYHFNGRYYPFYFDSDGYASSLGNALAPDLVSSPNGYKAWLWQTRAELAALEAEMKSQARNVIPVPRYIDGLKYDYGTYPATFITRSNTCLIERVYIIDIDAQEFKILEQRSYQVYPLDDIDEAVFQQSVGPAYAASQRVDSVEYDDPAEGRVQHTYSQLIDRLGTSTETQKLPILSMDIPRLNHLAPSLRDAAKLAELAYKVWTESKQFDRVNDMIHGTIDLDDKAFRETCYTVLAMVLAPFRGFFTGPVGRPSPEADLQIVSTDEPSGEAGSQIASTDETSVPVASEIARKSVRNVGNRTQDKILLTWLCPETSIFSVGGLAVFICPQINNEKILRLAVAYLIKHMDSSDCRSTRAIILSVQHAVLVEYTAGEARVSALLPFLRNRVEDSSEDDPLPSTCEVLADFWEAAELERLCRQGASSSSLSIGPPSCAPSHLPAELWIKILTMTSAGARRACLSVSRELRLCAQEYCYMVDDRPMRIVEIPASEPDTQVGKNSYLVEFLPGEDGYHEHSHCPAGLYTLEGGWENPWGDAHWGHKGIALYSYVLAMTHSALPCIYLNEVPFRLREYHAS